jgi:hypothetical protein
MLREDSGVDAENTERFLNHYVRLSEPAPRKHAR